MSKDTIYFPHDFNASTDPKLLKLRAKTGWGGYGIFWAILEQLRAVDGCKYKKDDIDCLSLSLGLEIDYIDKIITLCIELCLFDHDENYFWSNRMLRDFEYMKSKSKKAKSSATKRWQSQTTENEHDNANAMRTQCENDANAMQGKDSIGENRKEKERIVEQESALKCAVHSKDYFDVHEKKTASKKVTRGPAARMEEYRKWLDELGFKEGHALDLVLEWLEYKTGRREYYSSQKTLSTFVENLRKLSGGNFENAKTIVRTAIGNTSQGIYPLKNQSNGNSKGTKITDEDLASIVFGDRFNPGGS